MLDLLARHLEDMADLGARMGGRQGEALHDAAQARVGAGRDATQCAVTVCGARTGSGAGHDCQGGSDTAALSYSH